MNTRDRYKIERLDPWLVMLWRWVTRKPQRRVALGVDFSVAGGEDVTTIAVIRDNGDGTHTVLNMIELKEKAGATTKPRERHP